MRRLVLCISFLASTGCATFYTLSPGATDPSKGAWLAKTTSIFGWQLSDQEVLFCNADKTKPTCYRASGDVGASVKIEEKKDEKK
jgi:hypothetical protein